MRGNRGRQNFGRMIDAAPGKEQAQFFHRAQNTPLRGPFTDFNAAATSRTLLSLKTAAPRRRDHFFPIATGVIQHGRELIPS